MGTDSAPDNIEQVYVVGEAGGTVVKIGTSRRLEQRIKDLQQMSPVPLVLMWNRPGGRALEAALHRHFSNLRIHGEWFDFGSYGSPVAQIKAAFEAGILPSGEPAAPPACSACGHLAGDHDPSQEACSGEGCEEWRGCGCKRYAPSSNTSIPPLMATPIAAEQRRRQPSIHAEVVHVPLDAPIDGWR